MEQVTDLQEQPLFPTGKKEGVFAVAILICGLSLTNFVLFGGFQLGFAVGALLCLLCTVGYLLWSGSRPTGYSWALLGLSAVIAASFARSNDGFVKFVMLCFLFISINLGLCLGAGKAGRDAGSVYSLLDAPKTFFSFGFGKSPEAFRGLRQAFRNSGTVGQKGGALLLGLCLAVPVLPLMIFLLMRADAAFEGLMDQLPDFRFGELVGTVIVGAGICCVLYVRGVALRHSTKVQAPSKPARKGLHVLTVNTLLCMVCLVYGVYLVSQLAYFMGGFAGILPQGYTLAQYARRGFFEMAGLCALNLGIVVSCLAIVRKQKNTSPLSTRLLCLFLGLVTLFLVVAASGKMLLYIERYGLTRLRFLTQAVMLFFGLTTVLVSLWLFLPRLPYMKGVILGALIIGAAVSWADVDTQVASYNVDAYLAGTMEQVDVAHLGSLNEGAIPSIVKLAAQAPDRLVAEQAAQLLKHWHVDIGTDLRGWNYVNHVAKNYVSLPTADGERSSE